jgi:hypothetical protein
VVDLIEACKKAKCRALLIEENLEGPRMDAGELYGIIHDLHAEFRSAIQVAGDGRREPSAERREHALRRGRLRQRGADVAAFPTVAQAEAWLRERIQPG